ncbi:MAG: transcriptional regulator [Thermoproteota archaeon]
MQRRKALGITIFVVCIVTFFVYAYLLMLSEWSPIVLHLSVLMIAGGILGVISWIGYTMATTKSGPSSIISDDEEKK